jgi:hypothetical protein
VESRQLKASHTKGSMSHQAGVRRGMHQNQLGLVQEDFMSWGVRLYPIHGVGLGLEENSIVQHRVDAQRNCSGMVSLLQEDQLY